MYSASLALLGSIMLNVIEGGRPNKALPQPSKVELQSVLHSFPEAVFLFDKQAQLTDLNPPAEQLAKQERSQLLGIEIRALLAALEGPGQHLSIEQLVQRALQGESSRHERCVFLAGLGGEPIEVLVSSSPVRDTASNIVGALVVVQDVTELTALQRQMASSERHFAVGQMTAGLAHDFNNVLSTISQAIYVMEMEPGRSEHDRSMLAIIQNGVRRGAEIVGNIRDYLLGSREARSRIDMRRLLEEVLQLAKPLFEVHGNIHVSSELQETCEVNANAPELRRVFTNLLLNAMDAMPEGGTLTLTCRVVGTQVLVSVRDTGSGIPLEKQKLIFSPYFTTKPRGTGLGLAGARRTIQAQGGDIRFESQPGVGTTFNILLPVAEPGEHKEYHAA